MVEVKGGGVNVQVEVEGKEKLCLELVELYKLNSTDACVVGIQIVDVIKEFCSDGDPRCQ